MKGKEKEWNSRKEQEKKKRVKYYSDKITSEQIPDDQDSKPYTGEMSTVGIKASPCVKNTAKALLVCTSLTPFHFPSVLLCCFSLYL